jgi:hypothetical protein
MDKEDRRAMENADPSQGFSIHQPTEDELDEDDGYVHEPPEVAAADVRPTGEPEDAEGPEATPPG